MILIAWVGAFFALWNGASANSLSLFALAMILIGIVFAIIDRKKRV